LSQITKAQTLNSIDATGFVHAYYIQE